MTRRAAIYVRISDDREGAGLGVERQEKDCRRLASRLGWDVAEVFVDNDLTAYGKSNKARPRPGYERLVAALAAGEFHGVVVWHTDRLHRTPRQLEDFIDVIEKQDVPVETVEAGVLDLRTPSGRAVARTLCAWAFYESEHKSARTRAKYVQLAEQGMPGNGGFRPFGYTKDRLHVVEEEAEHLRWAYAQVLTGRSLRSIALDFERRGIRSSQGKQWTVQALRYNLLSPRNTGLREHRGIVVGEAVWAPIVDRDTWQRVQAMLRQRRPSWALSEPFTNARRHLLTGFLWCLRCQGRVIPRAKAQNGKRRYGCLASADGGCGGASVGIDDADAAIVDLVLDRIERDADLTRPTPHDPTEQLLTLIAAEEQRLKDLAAAFADDPDGNPLELRAAGANIRGRIANARTEISRVSDRLLIADPLTVRDAWPDYDLAQRRAVIGQQVERIDVGPGRPGRFDPNRLDVTWR